MQINKIVIFFAGVLLSACNSRDNVEKYLFDHLGIQNNSETEVYYIIDLHGCDYCIDANLLFLEENLLDLNLIFVGRTFKREWIEKINVISKNYNIIEDKERFAAKLSLDLAKPMLLIIKDQNIVKSYTIDDADINQIFSILQVLPK